MYEKFKCVICDKMITGEYGNNAEPVAKGTCCQECNDSTVLSARLMRIYGRR